MRKKDRKAYPEKAKDRIKAGMMVGRLYKHVMGEIEMSATQVNAAKILLNKVLPDMKAIEQTSTQDVVHYVINAHPDLEPEDWRAKHAPSGSHSEDHKPH